jgi:Protein of unknown function (DUF3987)
VERLEPDREQIKTFVYGMFLHASANTFFSTRAFHEETQKPFGCFGVRLSGGLDFIVKTAFEHALRAANHPHPIVYCTPIATFANKDHAAEKDLAEGLALSVECDRNPVEAGNKLIAVLGNPTCAVCSGGIWIDPETGEIHEKRHFHWRLDTPARSSAEQTRLKYARELATRFVGGDVSNVSIVHPLRMPGSWHRKAEPILCKIEFKDFKREINLEQAIAALERVCPAPPVKPNGKDYAGTGADWTGLIQEIISGNSYHVPLTTLAAKKIAAGMNPGAVVNELRALMDLSAGPRDERWRVRYDDIPRLVHGAEKFRSSANGHVIEADYHVIAGLIEQVKQTENPDEPKIAAEPKAAKASNSEPSLLQYTHDVPGAVGEIIEWVTDSARRPNRVLALGAAVTIAGTLIGRRVAGPTRSATHLYTVAIGGTGYGKQHGINCVTKLMHAAKADSHIGAGEYFSLSGVYSMLENSPLLLCLQDEFGKFLQAVTDPKANSWEKSMSRILRTLWGTSFGLLPGVQWARESKPAIWCPALSVFGFSTPDEFHAALQGESIGNGFVNRLLALDMGTRTEDIDPAIDPDTVPARLMETLSQLYLWSGPESLLSINATAVPLNPDILPWASNQAQAAYKDFSRFVDDEGDRRPEIRDFISRSAETAIRLATIRAAGRWGRGATVDVSDAEWGAGIVWAAAQ